jgi:rRNA maturation endonuclease Nob1
MALCTSCGNQVEEPASFCTSCGKPMPAAAHPSATVTVTRPVCSSCGAQADPDSVFCTECGKRLDAQPASVAEVTHDIAAAAPLEAKTAAKTASPNPVCMSCGTKIEPSTTFCTNCGQPASAALTNVAAAKIDAAAVEATQPVSVEPIIEASVRAEPTKDAIAAELVVAAPSSSRVESAPAAVAATPLVEDRPAEAVPMKPAPVEPAPQIAPPLYATPTDYPPAQPGGGAFRLIVLILLLVIVLGVFGGWYFMGVETVIVCSPPDVKVFLDDKELPPTSYGRYVVPHLSRQPHLLRVQRAGFADTIERMDFPMTSLHEWVNIKLVPRRPARPSRR